jgi:lysophospholipase L1-like esterase
MAFAGLAFINQQKPTIYLIGDSTTHNNDKETWGWGSIIPYYFDLAKINVENHAMAGRSTRTFIKEGRWNKVDSLLKPGDYVLMVFGHNEGSKPDTTKAGYRGVLNDRAYLAQRYQRNSTYLWLVFSQIYKGYQS